MKPETLQWNSLEYTHREKSIDWFWAVGIIALAVAVTAVIYHNILFAVFIIIGTFTLLMFAARKPRSVEFEINKRGLRIDRVLYPYSTLHSFWIHDHEEKQKKLIIQSEKVLMPYVSIPIPDDVNVDVLRDFLDDYLPEEEHPESLSEALMEYLGF